MSPCSGRVFLALVAVVVAVAGGTSVTIDNLVPRLDTSGKIMDAHDGSIQRFGGFYYMHAVSYGLCEEPANLGCDQTTDHCGFRLDHNISIWRSRTLQSGSWEYRGLAIAPSQRPAGVLYRPHVVFNPTTAMYVLWWNYVLPSGGYAGYAAATSASPDGPFVLQNALVNITRGPGAGDYDLFVDAADGTGYLIYSAHYWMSIEVLTPDFLYSTGKNASCGPGGLVAVLWTRT
jgi:hypothetical protein